MRSLLVGNFDKKCKSDPMMTPPIAPPKISDINEKYTFDQVAIFGAIGLSLWNI